MNKKFTTLLAFVTLLLWTNGQECSDQPDCDFDACVEPNCACFLSEPEIPVENRPQIIYLSFDGALSLTYHENYLTQFFNGRYTNPNGCPIRGSFFLNAYGTDYTLAREYYVWGNEIASEGVTDGGMASYWDSLSTDEWADEMGGMKRMASTWGNIPEEDIVGTHVPLFHTGGDMQWGMMEDEGFLYDYSQSSRSYGYTNLANGAWPYTLDYESNLDCNTGMCPTCSYEGMWNQPFLQLEDLQLGQHGVEDLGNACDILDSCYIPSDYYAEQLFDMLKNNFQNSYYGNTRAPIGFMATPAYFDKEWHIEGITMFMDYVAGSFDDVWFVTPRGGIEYRRSPVTNEDLKRGALEEWFGCDSLPLDLDCVKTDCTYYDVVTDDWEKDEVTMHICGTECPEVYPWLGNPYGEA